MKKMMFIAAIALCAMSCGNKAANTEAEATDSCAVEVVDTTVVEEVVDTTVVDTVVAEVAEVIE